MNESHEVRVLLITGNVGNVNKNLNDFSRLMIAHKTHPELGRKEDNITIPFKCGFRCNFYKGNLKTDLFHKLIELL